MGRVRARGCGGSGAGFVRVVGYGLAARPRAGMLVRATADDTEVAYAEAAGGAAVYPPGTRIEGLVEGLRSLSAAPREAS